MKYQNKQDFIKSCNENGNFRNSIGREITELDLKKYSILPDFEGKYSDAQKFILFSKIRKEEGYEFFDKEALTKISSLKSLLERDINLEEIQKFLLIYLSDKFQENLKGFREVFGVPENGFGPKDGQECAKWFMKRKGEIISLRGLRIYNDVSDDPELIEEREEFYRALEFRHMAFLDTLMLAHYGKKIRNYKFEVKKPFLTFNIPEIPAFEGGIDLFGEYNLNIEEFGPFAPASVTIFDLWKPLFIPYRKYFGSFSPITCNQSSDQLEIIISKSITRQNLVDYINANWSEIKRGLNEMFKPVRFNKNLLRNVLVVQLHKQGKKDKEIKNILKEYSLTPEQIKKILKRTKKKIKQLEPVRQEI